MSEFSAEVSWERKNAPFRGGNYSRGHQWSFDGGQVVPASSSPHVVPLPHSVAAYVDPEKDTSPRYLGKRCTGSRASGN